MFDRARQYSRRLKLDHRHLNEDTQSVFTDITSADLDEIRMLIDTLAPTDLVDFFKAMEASIGQVAFSEFMQQVYSISRPTSDALIREMLNVDADLLSIMQIDAVRKRNAITELTGKASGNLHMTANGVREQILKQGRIAQDAGKSYRITKRSRDDFANQIGYSLSLNHKEAVRNNIEQSSGHENVSMSKAEIDLVLNLEQTSDFSELADDDFEEVGTNAFDILPGIKLDDENIANSDHKIDLVDDCSKENNPSNDKFNFHQLDLEPSMVDGLDIFEFEDKIQSNTQSASFQDELLPSSSLFDDETRRRDLHDENEQDEETDVIELINSEPQVLELNSKLLSDAELMSATHHEPVETKGNSVRIFALVLLVTS